MLFQITVPNAVAAIGIEDLVADARCHKLSNLVSPSGRSELVEYECCEDLNHCPQETQVKVSSLEECQKQAQLPDAWAPEVLQWCNEQFPSTSSPGV